MNIFWEVLFCPSCSPTFLYKLIFLRLSQILLFRYFYLIAIEIRSFIVAIGLHFHSLSSRHYNSYLPLFELHSFTSSWSWFCFTKKSSLEISWIAADSTFLMHYFHFVLNQVFLVLIWCKYIRCVTILLLNFVQPLRLYLQMCDIMIPMKNCTKWTRS